MNVQFSKPKRFGEIMDHTFTLSKQRFSDLFTILLILIGPIYILQAIIQLLSGVQFFRDVGNDGLWYEQMMTGLEETSTATTSSLGGDIVMVLASIILYPVAEAAILIVINHIKKAESYTVGSVIKKAFSRFWPILGSTILFGLIAFGLIIVPVIVISLAGVIGAIMNPVIGIVLGIVLFLGFAVVIGYLLTRWSFYFGAVVLEEDAPGLSRSWRLTRNRTWVLLALYIVFSLIIFAISAAMELSAGMLLGNSVFMTIIVNIVSLFTTMIFTVGYAVMFLDLKTRHDADDLKEMIEDYNDK
ncbi:hypothetical protein NC797_12830 [Aquibacillus sp. 3ASR75-11]|uniref:DUF7847 domain-containing protein n=1 Tax=Terrihalobacillus insolitus TaxID=2950438 RepID=A0A9X3WTR8_9BACI|nr:hypothetical protein [Terrihalobacillus insolitus]MDC3414179.1 hypothetical protein [Terrihalobacillus insolitus]MDC3425385.1 hypothetical protein [Terrihalobacillus insolitus]